MNSREASIISSFLREAKWRVKGQHFLINRRVREKLAKIIKELNPKLIIEVGSGLGFITEEMIKLRTYVISVEIDKRLCMILKKRILEENLDIINADALKIDFPEKCVIAGAPPYYISSSLLTKCIVSRVSGAVLILQKEFVDKLSAPVGARSYSYLSCLLNTFGQIKTICEVDKSDFFPRPRVNSVLVKITLNKHMEVGKADREKYLRFVSEAFKRYKNRKLREFLKEYRFECLRLISERLDLERRILSLSGEDLLSVFKAVKPL